jgi:hypothetical protein
MPVRSHTADRAPCWNVRFPTQRNGRTARVDRRTYCTMRVLFPYGKEAPPLAIRRPAFTQRPDPSAISPHSRRPVVLCRSLSCTGHAPFTGAGGGIDFIHTDHLNAPRATTDQAGVERSEFSSIVTVNLVTGVRRVYRRAEIRESGTDHVSGALRKESQRCSIGVERDAGRPKRKHGTR